MRKLLSVAGLVVLLGVGAGAITFPLWRGWLETSAATEEPHGHGQSSERVKLSPQAGANLKLRVGKVELVKEPYWRSIQVPGWVVERQGSSERLVTAPLVGVVKSIGAARGDILRPGATLFTLGLVGEQIASTQTNLHKTARELEIARDEKKRLADAGGAIPMSRMIEADNKVQLLVIAGQALEHELTLRGLGAIDIDEIKRGKFLQEIIIRVPPFAGDSETSQGEFANRAYELEEMKVVLGEQVNAGAPLCLLGDHHELHIEGRVFASESALIQSTARDGLPIHAEFARDGDGPWSTWNRPMQIGNLASRIDPNHQTLSFFLKLPNQFQEYKRGEKTYRLWRFRPGQRVQLKVPVESFKDVFVLPAEAVVREGAENLVFRENGDFFERKPVHILYADRQIAIVANDGSILPGDMIALNSAAQINWAIKTQSQGDGGHEHSHAH